MGIIISSEKEIQWIKSEHKLQRFYFILTIVTFLLMVYVFVKSFSPENILMPIYTMTFLFSFLTFMITTVVLTKSHRYLKIIDTLLDERRR